MDLNNYFDDYESDPILAKNIDSICEACPVREFCLADGINSGATGCWGGMYLENGRLKPSNNKHKSESNYRECQERYDNLVQ